VGSDVTAPREIPDVAAELETLRQLQADARRQINRTRATIATKHQEIGALEMHETQLVMAVDGRDRKIDRLLDELSALLAAQRTADALVD